jgi:2-dehydro-3-deoxy-D-arabinonate dehydratase
MKLHRTCLGIFASDHDNFFSISSTSWDDLIARDHLLEHLKELVRDATMVTPPKPEDILSPVASQEVWAAGVTYYRSRDARMQESKDAGGGSFYDRVYAAERPELFFKSLGQKVVGPNGKVAIRDDAKWSVPEPELTLYISPSGQIAGYTIGNDMSSRDIEGENPLYLPQAKVYDRACALGPCLLLTDTPLPATTAIEIEILRAGKVEFSGATSLKELKRDPRQLVEYLYRHSTFPQGCFLLTGTGVVPPDSFTLRNGDEIKITIPPIGVLTNTVG